jgi:hypothetical protein
LKPPLLKGHLPNLIDLLHLAPKDLKDSLHRGVEGHPPGHPKQFSVERATLELLEDALARR